MLASFQLDICASCIPFFFMQNATKNKCDSILGCWLGMSEKNALHDFAPIHFLVSAFLGALFFCRSKEPIPVRHQFRDGDYEALIGPELFLFGQR